MYLLRIWAAAIASHIEGVDLEHPPPGNEFKARDDSDIAQLATCHLNSSQPNIIVNLSGLKALIPQPGPKPIHALAPPVPAKLPLHDFCDKYDLLPEIFAKLSAVDIEGPHTFRFFTDAELMNTANLTLGQHGSVHDVVEHWLLDSAPA
ncbi:hypothetical protein BT96DRAFT_990702 [Gymnopus androsaceus JB14]|uniref:Uncharacterized protein n=1 Tax=Gymnopus androsaceus JB14 TaxID=1447944 RepID=A0A6A4HUZ9_9AGAR|nr:hypothetical protein BT96DRAFT_990702 [Gymnopus androsaceus JB14]